MNEKQHWSTFAGIWLPVPSSSPSRVQLMKMLQARGHSLLFSQVYWQNNVHQYITKRSNTNYLMAKIYKLYILYIKIYNNWKLISFNSTWLLKKIKKLSFTFSKSSSFSPSLVSLYLFEQCLRRGVRGTSSVCLPLQDESLYVLTNCKSLWIKASAKWLNVNINNIILHKNIIRQKHS